MQPPSPEFESEQEPRADLPPFFRKSFLRRHWSTGSVESSPTYHTLACPPGAFFLDLSITFLYDLFSYVRSSGSYPLGLSKPLMEGYME